MKQHIFFFIRSRSESAGTSTTTYHLIHNIMSPCQGGKLNIISNTYFHISSKKSFEKYISSSMDDPPMIWVARTQKLYMFLTTTEKSPRSNDPLRPNFPSKKKNKKAPLSKERRTAPMVPIDKHMKNQKPEMFTKLVGGWTDPSEQICASQNGWTSSPSFGVKIKNYLNCHRLEKLYTNFWKCESIQLLIQNHLMR